MSFFVFDMDETLAELYSVYYFVASLRMGEVFKELPSNLHNKLDKAYNLFVADILKEETVHPPLGILRPGILKIMDQLYELYKQDKIKGVVIYSNNSHLQSLEFIRDLIHKYLKTTDFIKECIHWNHHMRSEERMSAANKTWNVLKNILVTGNCAASNTLEPSDVFFFDDLDHEDLQEKLGINYYKVPPYEYKASFGRISEIYMDAIINADIDIYDFIKYISKIFGRPNNYSFIGVIEMFQSKTKEASEQGSAPPPDEGIEIMKTAIKKIKMAGGKRRLFRDLRKTRLRPRRQRKTRRKN